MFLFVTIMLRTGSLYSYVGVSGKVGELDLDWKVATLALIKCRSG